MEPLFFIRTLLHGISTESVGMIYNETLPAQILETAVLIEASLRPFVAIYEPCPQQQGQMYPVQLNFEEPAIY